MGARELFISWPRTRISRCQAWRSSARKARLTSDSTRSWWGRPPWRKVPRCTSHRPMAPGKAISRTPGVSAASARSSPSSAAVRPSSRSAGLPSRVPPARLTSRRWSSPSKAKTATSTSSITFRSSAVASRAPRRCSRRVSARALTSSMAWASASSPRVPRALNEKSSSRRAESRFDRVCSGRTTSPCSAKAKPSHTETTRTPRVHVRAELWSPARSSPRLTAAPGRPPRSARSRTRLSWGNRVLCAIVLINAASNRHTSGLPWRTGCHRGETAASSRSRSSRGSGSESSRTPAPCREV